MKNIESNDEIRVAEALEAMRAEAGRRFSLATVNWRNWNAALASHGRSFVG